MLKTLTDGAGERVVGKLPLKGKVSGFAWVGSRRPRITQRFVIRPSHQAKTVAGQGDRAKLRHQKPPIQAIPTGSLKISLKGLSSLDHPEI